MYSGVPITRAGSIKRAGRNFHDIFPNEQALLSEQGGIFITFPKPSRVPTTTALHLLNGGKIQILILHGAKTIKISVSLTLSTVSWF